MLAAVGAPEEPSTSATGSNADSARRTPGSLRTAPANGGSPGYPDTAYCTVRSDGLVLARNTGNDACVRLAAAADPRATPPVSPITSTSPR